MWAGHPCGLEHPHPPSMKRQWIRSCRDHGLHLDGHLAVVDQQRSEAGQPRGIYLRWCVRAVTTASHGYPELSFARVSRRCVACVCRTSLAHPGDARTCPRPDSFGPPAGRPAPVSAPPLRLGRVPYLRARNLPVIVVRAVNEVQSHGQVHAARKERGGACSVAAHRVSPAAVLSVRRSWRCRDGSYGNR